MTATLVFAVLVIFVAGIVAGTVLIVSLASRREDRDFTISGTAPTRLTRMARELTGLTYRDDVVPDFPPAAVEREKALV
jgi:hypothetical protein